MSESACRREDLPAFGGPTSAICAAPSRRTCRESRCVTVARTRVRSSSPSSHFRRSAYGPLRYPGSSESSARIATTRALPCFPTRRRLATSANVRCGMGIAHLLPTRAGGARARRPTGRGARHRPASPDARSGSGRSAVLSQHVSAPGVHRRDSVSGRRQSGSVSDSRSLG